MVTQRLFTHHNASVLVKKNRSVPVHSECVAGVKEGPFVIIPYRPSSYFLAGAHFNFAGRIRNIRTTSEAKNASHHLTPNRI